MEKISSSDHETVERFHKLYYDEGLHNAGTWNDTYWMGIPIYKCPQDMIIYAEILHEVRPDVIIETGTADGGGALFLASICDLIGKGRVITIDILSEYKKVKSKLERPAHPRINYITGSSISDEIVSKVKSIIKSKDAVMVILDSDHRKEHVLSEMRAYSGLVTVGSYMIVEDSNINGHPAWNNYGPGPMEAIKEFLSGNDDFVVDAFRERLLLTFNPSGYLKRR